MLEENFEATEATAKEMEVLENCCIGITKELKSSFMQSRSVTASSTISKKKEINRRTDAGFSNNICGKEWTYLLECGFTVTDNLVSCSPYDKSKSVHE